MGRFAGRWLHSPSPSMSCAVQGMPDTGIAPGGGGCQFSQLKQGLWRAGQVGRGDRQVQHPVQRNSAAGGQQAAASDDPHPVPAYRLPDPLRLHRAHLPGHQPHHDQGEPRRRSLLSGSRAVRSPLPLYPVVPAIKAAPPPPSQETSPRFRLSSVLPKFSPRPERGLPPIISS